ncbi:MAG: hypothetical protein PHO66_05410 [Eubacteriales bacterium]|nr:hypothetical protein [Eubacteriales bacterium]
MKSVVVSIPNNLLSGGLCLYLKSESGFRIFREDRLEQLADTCVAAGADVLLAEVRPYSPYTVEDWLTRFAQIKRCLPQCRVAFVVDENSSPDVAKEVKRVKGKGRIDAFFYGTVSGEYVAAVIGSL